MKNVFRYSEIVSLFNPLTIVKALGMVGLMFCLLTLTCVQQMCNEGKGKEIKCFSIVR